MHTVGKQQSSHAGGHGHGLARAAVEPEEVLVRQALAGHRGLIQIEDAARTGLGIVAIARNAIDHGVIARPPGRHQDLAVVGHGQVGGLAGRDGELAHDGAIHQIDFRHHIRGHGRNKRNVLILQHHDVRRLGRQRQDIEDVAGQSIVEYQRVRQMADHEQLIAVGSVRGVDVRGHGHGRPQGAERVQALQRAVEVSDAVAGHIGGIDMRVVDDDHGPHGPGHHIDPITFHIVENGIAGIGFRNRLEDGVRLRGYDTGRCVLLSGQGYSHQQEPEKEPAKGRARVNRHVCLLGQRGFIDRP